MSPPTTRVNTFVQEKPVQKNCFDRISKIFIVSELLCGINRISVLSNIKPIFIAVSFVISIAVNISVIYFSYLTVVIGIKDVLKIIKICQYLICTVLAFSFRNRLKKFFSELDDFDKESGFQKVNQDTITSIVQLCFSFCFMGLLLTFLLMAEVFEIHIGLMQIAIIHVAELHFYGHLLNLLVPRLRCIYRLMKSSFERYKVHTVQNELTQIEDKKHSSVDMKKFLYFYHKIIRAFDALNDAIKWQMLTILVTSFVTSLYISFNLTLLYIQGQYSAIKLVGKVIWASFEMIPLFAPCGIVDAVHGEVRCLREQLSSKLYENKIEKSDRAVAQALLALIQARDLSFSLLRIFDIDVSFPFKFMGLLVTYLIILLQFEKVINLDRKT